MSSLPAILRYLYSLQHRGMKLGLRNTRALLRMAGNPERDLRCFHVAGTNGKGSTSSFLASILQESGSRVGLYTSPHLVHFSERIRINGRPIPDETIAAYVRRLKPAIESTGATFFEATTCLAFCWFADEGVDLAVIETGLGGRLDSTNVIKPLTSVISTIALDHTHILGSTLRAIAREKAGIIKMGVPCVTSSRDPGVLTTFDRIASARRTRVSRAGKMLRIIDSHSGRFRLHSRSGWETGIIEPGLAGAHQRENARLAVAAVHLWSRRSGGTVSRVAVERGIAHVVRNTGLRGRCERAGRFIFDVAHNPEGADALSSSLINQGEGSLVVVIGMMEDKELPGIILPLSRIAYCFVTVTPVTGRALPEKLLRRRIHRLSFRAYRGGSVSAGLRRAAHIAGKERRILVTGSHYVVGSALGQMKSTFA
ncbi:MAG: bifunctional folylpolyglutamate synthase/dihydrofolate synthase [Ignavibacteria bacterium]|nr:bifunctional folylpolyglutamate synthase/dihydrofolate synthase [Ignavibacteria bacterium]